MEQMSVFLVRLRSDKEIRYMMLAAPTEEMMRERLLQAMKDADALHPELPAGELLEVVPCAEIYAGTCFGHTCAIALVTIGPGLPPSTEVLM